MDKCLEMLETVGEVFLDTKYQRYTMRFYRNVFSIVLRSKVKLVVRCLRQSTLGKVRKPCEKAKAVIDKLLEKKLKGGAKKVEDSIEETPIYYDFPSEYWVRIRTNNVIEGLNWEVCRCTCVVSSFLDGNFVLMLIYTRLFYLADI